MAREGRYLDAVLIARQGLMKISQMPLNMGKDIAACDDVVVYAGKLFFYAFDILLRETVLFDHLAPE